MTEMTEVIEVLANARETVATTVQWMCTSGVDEASLDVLRTSLMEANADALETGEPDELVTKMMYQLGCVLTLLGKFFTDQSIGFIAEFEVEHGGDS